MTQGRAAVRQASHRALIEHVAGAAWEQAVNGEVLITGVQEQWRTGNSNDDKLGREYDVRLTVDVTITAPGLGTRRRFDVSLTNKDAPKLVAGARLPCEALPTDLSVLRVYVRQHAPHERFENGRELDGDRHA